MTGPGVRRAIGLMSGTSMDGVDVALIETDGVVVTRHGPTSFFPYGEDDRALLRAALGDAASLADRHARPGVLVAAEARVTDRHGGAVEAFLKTHAIGRDSVDLIGFHGQTVLHKPERGFTVQIGDGAALAQDLGIDVVADLRAADMAAGGQGAPLVPIYHQALARSASGAGRLDPATPMLVINIGGVSNITFLPTDGGDPIAGDTGPGNALIDDLMLERTGQPIDRDGACAARGVVNAEVLATLMRHPFFGLPVPKSLDRNAFSREPVASLSTEDAAATLTAFTAAAIAAVLPKLPKRPSRAIVCGGGARNPTLMAVLRDALGCDVITANAAGWNGDAVEAEAFAYLAVRSLAGLPLTFPSTTGAKAPVTGGVLFPARARLSRAS